MPPLQVQCPAAGLDAVLPAHKNIANKPLKPRARVNRRTIVIGSGRLLAVGSFFHGLRMLMRKHRRPATLIQINGDYERARHRRMRNLVMAGLVPAISLRLALCFPKRDHRAKPGDDRSAAFLGVMPAKAGIQ